MNDHHHLFSLFDFPHRVLFEKVSLPWEALDQLFSYISSLSLGKIEGEVSPQATLIDSHLITIEEGSTVEAGAFIKGPCFIGKGCEIRHGAYLRGNILLGNGCVIGHCSEVKNSIFFNRAKAPHFNYVGDSILGNEVNLGAGVICANLRLDERDVIVDWKGEAISSNRKKLGALIGDGAQIGCNCVLNPGTILARGALCSPCRAVTSHTKLKRQVEV